LGGAPQRAPIQSSNLRFFVERNFTFSCLSLHIVDLAVINALNDLNAIGWRALPPDREPFSYAHRAENDDRTIDFVSPGGSSGMTRD
jgi:hypothetical protein